MITAVTACMGRLEHLETTLPLMLEAFERVIVVDWSCPQKCGDWAEKEGAQVVRKTGERYWNASKARNMGAHQVKTRSVCFIDADVMVTSGLQSEIEGLLDLSHMVLAPRDSQGYDVHNLNGFIALDIGQFWGVKGYREFLEGYGLEDGYLRAQLALERGMKARRVSPASLGALRHSHELRNRYAKEILQVSAKRNSALLYEYLNSQGVIDWRKDPRTAEIAYTQEHSQ